MRMNKNFIRKLLAIVLAAGLLAGAGIAAADTDSSVIELRLTNSYERALIAIEEEDYETARKYLNICLVYCDRETNPALYADILLKDACLDVIAAEYDIALLEIDAALTVQPDLPEAHSVRAQILTSQGDYAGAAAALERYAELTDDPSAYRTIAELYQANGDAEAAQAAYERYTESTGADTVEAAFQAGVYRMSAGQYEDAISVFLPLTETKDDPDLVSRSWFNIGVCRMGMEDYAGALEAYNACTENGGEFTGLYLNRGLCKQQTQDYAGAIPDFTASIEKEPYAGSARYNLGFCQLMTADYEGALSSFNTVIGSMEAEDGGQAESGLGREVLNWAYYYRGASNAALGNLDAALLDYTICIENGFMLADCYTQRASVYKALGDVESQKQDLDMAMKVNN